MTYPVMLNLHDETVLIIGGGRIGARKVPRLLANGARLIIVSSSLAPELEPYQGQFIWEQTRYNVAQLDRYQPLVVFATTNQPDVNAQIVADARARRILVNRADDASDGTLKTIFTREFGGMSIAAVTGGVPALGAPLLDRIGKVITPELVDLLGWLARVRTELKELIADPIERETLWRKVAEDPIPEYIRTSQDAEARYLLTQRLQSELGEAVWAQLSS